MKTLRCHSMRCGAHVSFDPARRGHRGVHSSGWRLAGLMVWLCVSRWPAVGMRRSGCLGQRALHSCELYRARTCRHAPARLAFALMQCADVCAARRSLVRRASGVARSRSPLPPTYLSYFYGGAGRLLFAQSRLACARSPGCHAQTSGDFRQGNSMVLRRAGPAR